MNERIPPHSIEIERTVIGSMIVDTASTAICVERLNSGSFYMAAHKILFNTLKEMFIKSIPIDLMSLAEKLKDKDLLDKIGEETYLVEISESITTASNIPHHCSILLDKQERRDGIQSLTLAIESYFNDTESTSSDISSRAISKIISNQPGKSNGVVRLSSLLPGEFDRIEKIMKGGSAADIITGYKSIDSNLFIRNGDNVVIGGRPSMGKTSVTDCFVRNIASKGKRILKINLESSNENECSRSLSSEARVNLHQLNSGYLPKRDLPKLSIAAGPLSEFEIYYTDDPYVTPSKLYSIIHRLQHEKGKIDLLVIDFLQLMKDDIRHEGKRIEIGELSRKIKNIGKEFKVPTFIISQLSRPQDKNSIKRPTLADLKESGEIEQNADAVLLLHREEYYKTRESAEELGIQNKVEIIIAKNKNGPTGYIPMAYIKEFMRLEELVEENERSCWQNEI